MTDLHEVGVVSGLKGIESILKEAEATDLKIYFVVPSHVPFSPNLETSGGRFNPEIIRKALQRPDAVGLSECVGPYILAEFPDLLEAFDDTLAIPGMTLQGHLPDMYGPAMSACVAAGVSTDHESFCDKAVFERLRNGCHLMMREASAARNMPALLKTVMEHNLDTSMVSIVTRRPCTPWISRRVAIWTIRCAPRSAWGWTLSRPSRWSQSTAPVRSIWSARSADWPPDAARTSTSPPGRRISACCPRSRRTPHHGGWQAAGAL